MGFKIIGLLAGLLCTSCTIVTQRAPLMPTEVQLALLPTHDIGADVARYSWFTSETCGSGEIVTERADGPTNVVHLLQLCPSPAAAEAAFKSKQRKPSETGVYTDKSAGSKPSRADDYVAWCIIYDFRLGDQNARCQVTARYGTVVSYMSVLGVEAKGLKPTGDDLIRFTLERDTVFAKLAGK